MSKFLFYINQDPKEIQKLLSHISSERLSKACAKRGLPIPTNANKFIISVSKKGLYLCYFYFQRPTNVIELSPMELPHRGWKLYINY